MPVVGLKDLNNPKESEEEEAKRNELYSGGNRRGGGGSGLSVIGPGDEDDEDDETEGAKRHVGTMFSRAQAKAAEGVPPATGVPKRVITVYANGFTIDDGPFRSLDDPANKPFLYDVSRGVVPRELEDSAQESGAYHLELVDRRAEQYVPPAYVAFSGGGNTLGATADEAPPPVPVSETPAAVVVDNSQPTTTVQVRLANGARLKLTLNLAHTVAHLEAAIRHQTQDQRPFVLLAGFPPAPLTDRDSTIQQANLAGAAVTQKCSS